MENEGDIRFILGRLEGKVDALIAQAKDLRGSVAAHELRIQALENRWAWILGVSAACSCSIGFIINFFDL
jgi:hypothetical protein